MSIISVESTKNGIIVGRSLPQFLAPDRRTLHNYRAKIEINIRKEGKTNKQLERELRKLSFFRDNKRIWLIVNII